MQPLSPLPPATIKHVTSDFPRRHLWVRAFTAINAISIPVNLVMGSWVGAAFSVVFLVAALGAWRATTLFTAAHESGNKAAMFDGLEQLEHYFRVSTLGLLAGGVLGIGFGVVLAITVLGAMVGLVLAAAGLLTAGVLVVFRLSAPKRHRGIGPAIMPLPDPLDPHQLHRLAQWTRWNAWCALGVGGVLALTLVGVVVAWLPLWQGWVLLESARHLDQARTTGDPEALKKGLERSSFQFVLQVVYCGFMAALLSGLTALASLLGA